MMATVTVMLDTLTISNIDTTKIRGLAKRTAKPRLIKSAWRKKKDKR